MNTTSMSDAEHVKWTAICYSLCVSAEIAFAIYAVSYTKMKVQAHLNKNPDLANAEGFITARKTQNKWRIGWSFFSTAMGAWTITSPANYAVWAGWLGMVFYAIACGIPVLVISFLGHKVQERWPHCCSVADFALYRFGPTAKIFVTFITLFNMSIFMLAEFTTIGALFQNFVGDRSYIMIIIVGVLTTMYTTYGGLMVSIVTDQAQAIFAALLIVVISIYASNLIDVASISSLTRSHPPGNTQTLTRKHEEMPRPRELLKARVAVTFQEPLEPGFGDLAAAVTFREPLEPGFGDLAPFLGPNLSGYSSIYVMPCMLIAATVFNDAMWQRVWASEDETALRHGGMLGCAAITVAIFLLGLGGFLAAWGGLVDLDNTDPNLYLFQLFKSKDDAGQATVNNPISVVVLILAAVMNESAIDSCQNGMAACLSAHFLKGRPLIYARFAVFLITIPIIAVAFQGYNIMNLFLIGNMVCCCAFLLVLLGAWDSLLGRRLVTESGLIFGACTAVLTTTAYGIGNNWTPDDYVDSFRTGAQYAWMGNNYMWDYTLLASLSSLAGLLLFSLTAEALRRALGIHGTGITDLLSYIPGFQTLAGSRPADGWDSAAPAAVAGAARPGKQVDMVAAAAAADSEARRPGLDVAGDKLSGAEIVVIPAAGSNDGGGGGGGSDMWYGHVETSVAAGQTAMVGVA